MSSNEKIRVSQVCCSDRRMDIVDIDYIDTPTNKYNISCDACQFPDIETTPNPYYLAKNRVFTGIEIFLADLGNLLISDRVKKIFEILFPNICDYQKTYIQNTKISTNWWLAIPKNTIVSGEVIESIPRCEKCNQPFSSHPGSQYKDWIDDSLEDFDIVKSTNWHSTSNKDWKESWIDRDIFLSVRLVALLKKISAKGIDPLLASKFKGLNTAEKQWVEYAINTIGPLKNKETRSEATFEDLEKLKEYFKVKEVNNENIILFEKRFKCTASEIAKIICSSELPINIPTGSDEPCTMVDLKDWEMLKGGKKLIGFAFDDFGNSSHFDPKDKLCPVYYYDHEMMEYEMIYSSILDILN